MGNASGDKRVTSFEGGRGCNAAPILSQPPPSHDQLFHICAFVLADRFDIQTIFHDEQSDCFVLILDNPESREQLANSLWNVFFRLNFFLLRGPVKKKHPVGGLIGLGLRKF